jgi:hypothetical protein
MLLRREEAVDNDNKIENQEVVEEAAHEDDELETQPSKDDEEEKDVDNDQTQW